MAFSESTPAAARLRLVVALAAAVVLLAGVATVIARSSDSSSGATAAQAADTTTTAPPEPTTSSPPVVPASDEPAAIREIREQVARIRGLEWKTPLRIQVVSHAELVRRIREVNARDIDPVRQAGEGETLKLLHVIPQNMDYASALDDLYSTLVLGFYDPITKEMFVRDSGGEELEAQTKMTIAHELNHALTDQHFDFGSRLDRLEDAGRDEEAYAFVALIEGDARYVDQQWQAAHLSEEEQLAILFGGVDPSAVAEIPPFLLNTLTFPYEDGTEFVAEQVDTGGFAKLNQQYGSPPTSTEHILHPEVYAAGQGWSPPALPDLAAATGCTAVHEGTIGEFQMSQVLGSQIGPDEGRGAAEGWNGDAFQVVRCGAARGMVDRWQADNQAEAAEYAAALGEWAQGWAEGGNTPGPDGRFAGRAGAGRIVHRGTTVDLVLAGDQATADRISAVVG
ncbi:MAG: hypothetical protein M3179_06035 [Actinomycetota bacterium]|nr:hypothetical protein [Actinomycetota bacterium]